MPRDITITFSDGTKHQYNNTPDSVTPDDIEKRAKKDYPNKKISNISGGKKKPAGDPLSADPISANARPKGSVASDTPAKTSSSAPPATLPPPITKNDELDQVKKNAGVQSKSEKESKAIYKNYSEENIVQGIEQSKQDSLIDRLKDPESAKFRRLEVWEVQSSANPGQTNLMLFGEVNAKNSYGAYGGFSDFYALGFDLPGKPSFSMISMAGGRDSVTGEMIERYKSKGRKIWSGR
jgi:hypothetical protein